MVQMPAVNTPQFSWVLSRLPHHAQPVPPIYQPEFAARGVLYAADHPKRREYWVGASTAATLAANAIAPGLLDRYLGKTGFPPSRPSNRTPRRPGRTCGNRPTARRQGLRHSRHLRRRSQEPTPNCGHRTTTACSPPRPASAAAAALPGLAAVMTIQRRATYDYSLGRT